jgi:sialic acid synthase SpsE
MLFVAELGTMHKGIPALAFEMIRKAKASGADVVKFQYGWPAAGGPMRQWATENAGLIRQWCDDIGITLMASVFSKAGWGVACSNGVDILKMAHPETFASNAPDESYAEVLKLCLHSEKPVYISGALVEGQKCLWCIPKYPVYPRELVLPEKFDQFYGYSSHSHGIEDALLAIARGAKLIEKHVTLDKTEETIKDNHFALSFDEFAEMVCLGRRLEGMA